MKSFFKELFVYHHHYNQKLIAELQAHAGNMSNKANTLFCHVLNAHQIWNARILGETPNGVLQVHTLEACYMLDKTNFEATQNILESKDLNEVVTYTNTKGEHFSNTIRDILFHVVNHSTHHKGQLILMFRQQDIQPLVTDYIFYKRQQQ